MHNTQKIYLVHAGHVSMPAAHASFAALWPEAPILDLMEGSLAHDVSQDGGLTPAMFHRFELLGDYCVAAGATEGRWFSRVDLHGVGVPSPIRKLLEAALPE